MVPQLSFGTVDEILLPTSRILFTEHPFYLNLLGSPPASSVVSEEEKRKEMANMTKEGRDLIRNEIWREKVKIIQSQYLSI